MDEETRHALAVLDEIKDAEGRGKTFVLERGQILIVSNRRIGRRRTAFIDRLDPGLPAGLATGGPGWR